MGSTLATNTGKIDINNKASMTKSKLENALYGNKIVELTEEDNDVAENFSSNVNIIIPPSKIIYNINSKRAKAGKNW